MKSLCARPLDEWAPHIHWIADLKRANESLHLIQARLLLYGWSHFSASMDASLSTAGHCSRSHDHFCHLFPMKIKTVKN